MTRRHLFENLVNRFAHITAKARDRHGAGPEVGHMGVGTVADMQQMQFGIALACQLTGSLDHGFVEVVVRVLGVGRIDGRHNHAW
ncbi:hypothetical protein D3C84_1062790 [compost metagenome]